MPTPFDGLEIKVGGKDASLRFGMKGLMRLDYELGERYGLKESILAPVTLLGEDKQPVATTRLMEWLGDLGPGYMLRWAQFLYAGVAASGRWKNFEAFLDAIDEDELSAAIVQLARVMREQIASSPASAKTEAAAASPLSGETSSGGSFGPLDGSTSG